MKTIKEIFEKNPQLLEIEEVKELVHQFRFQYQIIKTNHYKYWDRVTDITLNSELFVIKGMSCKDAISKIHQLSYHGDNLPM